MQDNNDTSETDIKKFSDCPKYIYHDVREDQILAIAVKAVEIAKDDFYKGVGETIITKFFWLVGTVVTGIVIWLHNKGIINL